MLAQKVEGTSESLSPLPLSSAGADGEQSADVIERSDCTEAGAACPGWARRNYESVQRKVRVLN